MSKNQKVQRSELMQGLGAPKATLMLDIDGKPHVALIPDAKMGILLSLASLIFEDGKILVRQLPDSYQLEEIKWDW